MPEPSWLERVASVVMQTIDLVQEFFLDGFIAVMAVAVAAPLLGIQLVYRRMALVGLAVPELAGCGQAMVFFLFALGLDHGTAELDRPSSVLQMIGAAGVVALGLALLAGLARHGRSIGVFAGILFLLASGLHEIFYLESPYHDIFEDALHHGRILTVDEAGRSQVLVVAVVLVVLTLIAHRPLTSCAFDADQARLRGYRPAVWLFLALLLIGAQSIVAVPVVGPETVLTLLLIPPAIVRPAAPSLRAFGPLAVLAGLLGAASSFVLAVGMDWPPGPALVITTLAASCVVALVAWPWKILRMR